VQVGIFAIGRMKKGAESDLIERYCERFSRCAISHGLTFSGVHEFVESRASSAALRQAEEAEKITAALTSDGYFIALDERGKTMASPEFAALIERQKDSGTRQLMFAIGGPDGHNELIRQRADQLLSFGRMTWPHQIVRILLAEQLYRATMILSGHPYHRA